MRHSEIPSETSELPSALPGRVGSLVNKPRRFSLKDGQAVMLAVTPLLDDDGERIGLRVEATVDDKEIGFLSTSPNMVPPADGDVDLYLEDRGSWSVSNVYVHPGYRRLGIASSMYDLLARAGMKILASGRGYGGRLKPNGQQLWDSNRPKPRLGQRPKYQRFWTPKPRTRTVTASPIEPEPGPIAPSR